MQINVEVNDDLMAKAMKASDHQTQQAVIEEGLRMLICLSSRTQVQDMFGLFPFDIDDPDYD